MSAQGVKGLEASLPVVHTLLFFGLEPSQRFTMPSTSRIKLDVLMP